MLVRASCTISIVTVPQNAAGGQQPTCEADGGQRSEQRAIMAPPAGLWPRYRAWRPRAIAPSTGGRPRGAARITEACVAGADEAPRHACRDKRRGGIAGCKVQRLPVIAGPPGRRDRGNQPQ